MRFFAKREFLVPLLFVGFFLVFRFCFPPYWVPTMAMAPTLLSSVEDPVTKKDDKSGDRILYNRLSYLFRDMARGDIIVFKFPDKDPKRPPMYFIQRLIGLPGDKIRLASGSLFVNDKEIVEPYVKEPAELDYEATVPEKMVFVLGDNRNHSADSRYWGGVPVENIKGVAFYRYAPKERSGFLP